LATEFDRDDVLLVNLSGRGDKDVEIVASRGLGRELLSNGSGTDNEETEK